MRRLLLAIVLVAGILPGPAPARADGIGLRYRVTLDHPEAHRAQVWMKTSSLAQPTLTLSLSLRFPSFLSGLTVTDGQGNPLPFSLYGGTLVIQTQGSPEVLVTHQVEPSDWFGSDAQREYTSYIAAEYAMIRTPNLLFAPWQPVSSISVEFILPPGWVAVTPWVREGTAFRPSDTKDLMAGLALGPFEVVDLEVAGVPVRVGIIPGAPRETILGDVRAFFAFQYGIFGAFPYARFMAAFADRNVPPFHNGGVAMKNSFYLPSQYRPGVLAHEMFHMWNGGAIVPAGADELWFLEGGTEFYTTDTLFRTGRFPPVTWVGTYNWTAEQVAELEQTLGISLLEACRRARAEGGAVKDFAYWKGRLFFFLLNEKVNQATRGGKSMDDILRELYRWNVPFTNDDLLKVLASLTGTSFEEEFNRYLYGEESIPLTGFLQDADRDGLAGALEGRYGANPSLVDSDEDGLSDGAEIAIWRTQPLDGDTFDDGVADGARVQVKMDGRGGGWETVGPVLTDREGDVAQPLPEADLRALYLATDGYFLYISLQFSAAPANPDLLYQLHIDADLDGRLDHYLVQRPGWFIGFGEHHDGMNVERDIRDIRALTALRMDYRLPWHLIGSPARWNLGFRVRPINEDLTLDQLDLPGYWLTLSRSTIPYVRNGVDFRHRAYLPLVFRNYR
ncbi:MAG: hypothetical protein ACP5N6_14900 [Anaerolineae bacterium]